MARILHNNRVKFPKDFFSIVLCTNMAAMTSSENHLLRMLGTYVAILVWTSTKNEWNSQNAGANACFDHPSRETYAKHNVLARAF